MEELYDIAVIGAGPAGIATSCEAVIFGIDKIIVFEKSDNHSDTIRKFFKDNKPVDKDYKGLTVQIKGSIKFEGGTKEETLDLFEDALERHLIDAKFNTEISSIKKENDIFTLTTNQGETFNSKNIAICIGKMGKPNKPDYKIPKTLNKKANYNVNSCPGDEDILVVGGGNSAVEFAYFICEGNRVTFSYRRDKITKANPKNIKLLFDKVDEGVVKAKLGVDIEKLEDEEGKFKVFFKNGDIEYFDRIIYGLGGSSPVDFLKGSGVKFDEKSEIIIDENNKNADGLYLAGDIAGSIGGSIALALNHGYHIVNDIK